MFFHRTSTVNGGAALVFDTTSQHNGSFFNNTIISNPHIIQFNNTNTNTNTNSNCNNRMFNQTVLPTPTIQRKKSISIAIKQSDYNNGTSNYCRIKSRSLSNIGVMISTEDWLTNFQNYKAYKVLPSQKKRKTVKSNLLTQQQPVQPVPKESNDIIITSSLLSNDNLPIAFGNATLQPNSTTHNNTKQHHHQSSSCVSTTLKKKPPIEDITEPFTEKQLTFLHLILTDEGLISPEMDELTINTIIHSITYIKVRQHVIIFTRDNDTDNIYYIIDKGKLEYEIDNEVYELSKHESIGTRALIKHSKHNCCLKASERSYLYCLPIEKYKSIAQDFMEKQLEERRSCLRSTYFFGNLSSDIINSLADKAFKQKHPSKIVLIKEDKYTQFVYIVMKGTITCTKGQAVIKTLTQCDIFGEICLFSQIESLYSYTSDENSEVLMISHVDIVETLGKEAIRDLVFSMFTKAIEDNDMLNKIFTCDIYMKLFNCFQLKFYFHDNVFLLSQKKMFIVISGTAIKTTFRIEEYHNNLFQQMHHNVNINNKIVNGTAFIDAITTAVELEYNIIGDECIVFESDWNCIVKTLTTPEQYELFMLLKDIPLFKFHNYYVNFQIVNAFKLETYTASTVLLKDGPNSNKFYIIKSGTVQIISNNMLIKTLDKYKSFGDITSDSTDYYRHADFISVGKVECYVLDKAVYEQLVITNNKIYSRVKELMIMNHLTISLDNLYYIKELGHGAYGKVYLVHDHKQFYAMKTAEIEVMNAKKELAQMYINEKQIMSQINHPFIVNLYNTYKTRGYLFFLMEYVDGVSLRKLISDKKKTDLYNINEVRFYGAILFTVLSYLQSNKIIHRDLKPDNILIQTNGYLKVIDFGIATRLNDGKDHATTIIGSTYYMSPEVILGKNYNYSVDYWALGIILYEMFYGKVPFGHGVKEPKLIYKEITEKKPVLPNDINYKEFNCVIKGLLNKNPHKRITSLHKVKTLAFYNGFEFDNVEKMSMEPPQVIEAKTHKKELTQAHFNFMNFMRSNATTSSNDLGETFIKNKEYEYFSEF